MGNTPYKGQIAALTNDVISTKDLNLNLLNRDDGKNAYRIDTVELQITSHAGIADADYFIAEVDYKSLSGKAVTDLKAPDSKDFIERVTIGPIAIGTQTSDVEQLDPAKKLLVFKFKHCFITSEEAYLNILAHGLAAARVAPYEIWGQYVNLKDIEKFKSGVDLS